MLAFVVFTSVLLLGSCGVVTTVYDPPVYTSYNVVDYGVAYTTTPYWGGYYYQGYRNPQVYYGIDRVYYGTGYYNW